MPIMQTAFIKAVPCAGKNFYQINEPVIYWEMKLENVSSDLACK